MVRSRSYRKKDADSDNDQPSTLEELMEQDLPSDDRGDNDVDMGDDDVPIPPGTHTRTTRARRRRGVTLKPLYEPTPVNYDLRFEDLGGLSQQLRIIEESVIFRQENSTGLKRSGLKHVIGGILLEGPPGTGKTVCAHAIAAELSRRSRNHYTFFTHNAVESYSKWMGESERTLQRIFQAAANCKPAIIFFDEFDSLCPRRETIDRSCHSYSTIVGTLLSEFNKIQDNDTIIIATTNLKENIDPAMLRHGRFDFIIHFPLPSELERKEILQVKMKNYIVETDVLDFIAKHTDGYSGSSLTFLCEEAKLNAYKRQKDQLRRRALKSVEKQDFVQVFKTVQIPRQVANNGADILFDGVCGDIEQTIRPYIGQLDDLSMSNQTSTESTCFLVWSGDSSFILNSVIMPKVLERLSQPTFHISQKLLDTKTSENLCSPVKVFENVVEKAKSCGKPSIVFVERIDSFNLSPGEISEALNGLGKYCILVLCTASVGSRGLSPELMQLFKPFGLDRSYQLAPPQDRIIGECMQLLFQTDVERILKSLRPTLTVESRKKLITLEMLLENVGRIQDKSYQRISALRAEIKTLCKVSPPHLLTENMLALFE